MKIPAGILVLMIVFLSLAPVAVASTASSLVSRPRIAVEGSTALSLNWSGYAVTATPEAAGTVSEAEGSWVVPAVTCPKHGSSYAAFWVGIDGYVSETVEQTGVLAQCSNGKASYYAWYEFYPSPMYEITSFTVSPGNTISVSVISSGDLFTAKITDGIESYSTSATVSSAQRSSAEWIVERPELCSAFSCSLATLANFKTVTFSQCSATVSGATGSIDATGFTYEPINMVSSSGATLDTTSGLSSSGASFSVTYG